MRLIAAMFAAMHGLGHLVWFFTTSAPMALGKQARQHLDARRPFLVVDPGSAGGQRFPPTRAP